jgi:hypothetical protein
MPDLKVRHPGRSAVWAGRSLDISEKHTATIFRSKELSIQKTERGTYVTLALSGTVLLPSSGPKKIQVSDQQEAELCWRFGGTNYIYRTEE